MTGQRERTKLHREDAPRSSARRGAEPGCQAMTPSKWRDVLPARRLANKMPGRSARDAGKRIFHMAEITPARDECNKSDRRRCRQCRGKLPTPTDIPQYAFCTPFCWQQFYRRRCLVCEEPIRRRAEHQKSCIRRECKNELRRYPHPPQKCR
jgi:hypothetical protein